MGSAKTKPFSTDFILVNSQGRYLHRSNRTSTNSIDNAKTYKTYQGAGKRCEGTDYKYILVDEVTE